MSPGFSNIRIDSWRMDKLLPAANKERIIKHLMALYKKKDTNLMKQALIDWYTPDQKDYGMFAAKYSLNGELEMKESKLEAMDKWTKETDISFTPTIFVNDYQLPEIYTIEDLNYLL